MASDGFRLPPTAFNRFRSLPIASDGFLAHRYSELFGRDLDLFVRMGANTIRLYAWRQSRRHFKFLDGAHSRDLAVIAVYEMGTAEDTPVGSAQERALLRARLQSRLRISRHPALIAWLVGNELNGFWNECAPALADPALAAPPPHRCLAAADRGPPPLASAPRPSPLLLSSSPPLLFSSSSLLLASSFLPSPPPPIASGIFVMTSTRSATCLTPAPLGRKRPSCVWLLKASQHF